ncbi:sodium/proline symporter [Lipingzhangella sp. LS1_29]|uniref:Sodium/proline symporter n=1 Tax=Lipingzhangella rawalii TaxID=2055835 RepID=A0ABU2H1N2_9ACTN|nr:sodium/proline symporter [Lipingzhangella rawalii]MDS1269198.1 sodium/proline symporter [Lipingzhangella rawalii]
MITADVSVDVNPTIVTSFAIYLALIFAIAIYAARRWTGSMEGFYLGGRKVGNFVVALSAVTSGRSAWLVLGVTGMAFVDGASAVWVVPGYILMELFLFLVAAPRLRRFTGRMRDITLPDYFTSRLQGGLKLRHLTVWVLVIFMIVYVASQFDAGGKAFASTFGLDQDLGIWITALIVLCYTLVGGYVAVALSDMIQACFMLFGLVVLPIVVITSLGWGGMIDILHALDPALLNPYALGVGAIISGVGIGLGSPGNPHILVRYMSIDDPAKLRTAALWGTVWNVLMSWGAVYIGLAGRAIYQDVEALPGQDTEQLFPYLAADYLPPLIVGFLVAAVFAAIMSTADSQLLVGSSGIVRDMYERMLRPERRPSQRYLVRLSRLVVLFLCLFSAGLLYVPYAQTTVFWLVLFAWAGLGAAFGPPLLISLFWRGATAAGAAAGIITGTVVTITWFTMDQWAPELAAAIPPGLDYELIPGFAASALAVWLVSLVTRRPSDVDRIMADLASGQDASTEPAHGTTTPS